ncbi:NAD(P)H-dependent glycerol-3-phosphate dehydrogenase [Neoehrlichia mikurensis]|uniref:Glycerol-3-phosphate dehydrogenase [NAD(P)+] n=1 Tax=Neoehrlichia mikurensis TaxID=89586 RepID=A0A9Q9F5B1_9RICK|nr:NAD(P)H-dependent glycerol-3-phosphate dehydrogenase [Neoehrlichia mikurensis]QXK91745.1 NAD(P)H-dependent glycerol-3-phosphate dehydrogenase [Neoehrlichia mikurensis]QXK92957.1 NAD(P)H-dependent glycerol-3-phosphate dehydrogenase [Neoehrlichia mikurensis]QXK93435.1 NAD(P)H-dependent glycerol-3-phosphate dehydrogenase [Neoehrlichia mikurensis]UTO55611.1 NAD(P)H-dependent glycerol-3-phosphate dehydrogenase [Neoehrlichia mikurensis]UTO56532.1 NAD(P)H-dependent glycerol-3-phosphate dehydrogena
MKVTILGAGAFGTALALALSDSNIKITLWSRNQKVIHSIHSKQENSIYLPNYKLSPNINTVHEISTALSNNPSSIIITVPTQELRNLCISLQKTHINSIPILICSKGIENTSLLLPSEIVSEILPDNPILILSGPSFAQEIAQKLPCSLVLAGKNEILAQHLISNFCNSILSITYTKDLIGVQVGAAIKNVIAIACGIIIGKQLGHNALATVITRGMMEIKDLYIATHDQFNLSTLIGFSCLGDLVLTCTTTHSRNMSFGITIGQNNSIINNKNTILAEGITTAKSIPLLSQKFNIKLPICTTIYQLLYENLSLDKAIEYILHSSP